MNVDIIDAPQAAIGLRERLKILEGAEVESSDAEDQDIVTPAQDEEENVTPLRRSQKVRSTPKGRRNYTGSEKLDAILDKLKSPSPKARKSKQMKAKY